MDEPLLSRVEDAGLNAAAPREQRWVDGWIVRFAEGKAKRARCVNAVADGRLSLDDRIAAAAAVYRAVRLPMVVRITPFTRPATLDADLAARGWVRIDDTRVMVAPRLVPAGDVAPPPGFTWNIVDGARLATIVGAWRRSPPEQVAGHARRLAETAVPYLALALHADDGEVVACGQLAVEDRFAGLYDIFTAPALRGHGFASRLCRRLLALAVEQGADVGYLQVEADNVPARAVYARLGFADAYAYHYRVAPDA